MLLPALSSGVAPSVSTLSTEAGIEPSICSPCVLGKRVCVPPFFPPRVEDCDGGGPICTNIGPCIPFVNKQFRCCIPGGCSFADC